MNFMFSIFLSLLAGSFVESQSSSPNKCDMEIHQTVATQCANCRRNIRINCPIGFRKITRGRGKSGCQYRIGGAVSRFVRGCFHSCLSTRIEPRCCTNYWGQDCQACPTGSLQGSIVCSGRGLCFDGINGNGTCSCRGNVVGSVCERCASPKQYGPSCEQECACRHGRCDSGVDRTGRCECDSGWGGALCDVGLHDCSNLNCPANSRCVNETGTLECICNVGYEKTGLNNSCAEINPCLAHGLCHQFAICNKTGPGEFSCVCQQGFTGDGQWCSPVDPCQANNGGCPINSTFCEYTGPGQSRCNCKRGYKDLTANGCVLVDICGLYPNSTCDPGVNCSTNDDNGVISVICDCPLGTILKGLKCYTDLLTEIIRANDTGAFANQLNTAVKMFSLNYFNELSFRSPFTVLVPIDAAFAEEGFPDASFSWKRNARNHLVAGSIEINFNIETATSMHTLLGSNFTIKALRPLQGAAGQGDFFASLMYNGVMRGKFLSEANQASNGLFYVTDTFLDPSPLFSYNIINQTFLQTLEELPMLSQFYSFWKKSFTTREWVKRLNQTTFFLPMNSAFAALSADEIKFLNTVGGLGVLDTLLRHHFALLPLTTTDLVLVGSIQTYREILSVNVSDSGAVYLGKEQAKIVISEIVVQEGIIYFIDRVLLPSSIDQLVVNTCPYTRSIESPGLCGPCGRASSFCQDGEAQYDPGNSPTACLYVGSVEGGASAMLQGCQHVCRKNVTNQVCCSGFYGDNCWSCPGPTHSPCNLNGLCRDGREGDGTCSCSALFEGSDCSRCSRNFTYGSDCNRNCTCVHGLCDNTISSRGLCVSGSCKEGWAGEDCDRRSYSCGTESIFCHQHAVCERSANNTERCVCIPGYKGDGLNCIEFNPCEDSLGRGGCHVNAWCSYYGGGVSNCTCMALYSGDGVNCEPINRCRDGTHNCHPQATCAFAGPGEFKCICGFGYRGNGVTCSEVNSCLENNGGCHYRAKCVRNGPGKNLCKCAEGYQGNGKNCVGHLLVEIYEHPQLSTIKSWIKGIDTVRNFFDSINYLQVTAFLPSNNAWNQLSSSDYHFWVNRDHLPFLFRHHIAKEIISSSKLEVNSKLASFLQAAPISVTNITDQTAISITGSNTTYPITLPTLGNNFAKILLPDLQTFNGVIHIIDSVLIPPRDVVEDHPHILDIVGNVTGPFQKYSLFFSHLNSSGVAAKINASQKIYTIFALPDNLFDSYGIKSPESRFLSYHVIIGKIIRLDNFQNGLHAATLAGDGYQVTLTQSDFTYFVNGQALVGTGIRTEYGIIHELSLNFLEPIKNRCDRSGTSVYTRSCQPCSSKPVCPQNHIVLGKLPCRNNFVGGGFLHIPPIACRPFCLRTVKQPACCEGFFGPECEPCPGGVGNVCYHNGQCRDGIKGAGTCNCSTENFRGPACNECSERFYGSSCQSECLCVHGFCLDGVKGSGACICDQGYIGADCDKRKPLSDLCGGICHTSATCTQSGRCVCNEGYTGNGTSCSPVNPCIVYPDTCHRLAECTYVSAGRRHCQCKAGYSGDGLFCEEINPCLNSTASVCDQYAQCHHTGPDRYNCICNRHYAGDGKTCSIIDLCHSSPCHEYARCESQLGSFECQCLTHFSGNGFTCTGNIYIELINRRFFSFVFRDSTVRNTLTSAGPLTVFAPYKDLISSTLTDTKISLTNIVGCGELNRTQLETTALLYALDGTLINVTTDEDSLLLNNNAKLVDNGTSLSNGVLYTVNGTFSTSASKVVKITQLGDLTYAIETTFTKISAHRFLQLLRTTDMIDSLSSSPQRSWTFFVPTDEAFKKLSAYKQRQLVTDLEVAEEYARYHVVSLGNISPIDLINSNEVVTTQGSGVAVECSPALNGRLLVNGGKAKIESFLSYSVTFNDGTLRANLLLIDRVLDPPSVGGRCDETNDVEFEGTCTLCINSAMNCPSGAHMVGQRKSNCLATSSSWTKYFSHASVLRGCKPLCRFQNITRKCCKGFYGRDCHPCPDSQESVEGATHRKSSSDYPGLVPEMPRYCSAGYPRSVCSGNGRCDEGINGTGKCVCNSGFKGVACELCEAGRFSRNCVLCNCSLHGRCEEGKRGNGFCHCDQGWIGPTCSERLTHNATCNGQCVSNAICGADGQCHCKYGYVGDGRYQCDVMDFCDFNPCSEFATCSSSHFSVTCTCNHPYVGDGYICSGFDPCNNASLAPDCHPLARCVYVAPDVSRCQCPNGYNGDGVHACVLDSASLPVPQSCAIRNGGCSVNALCYDIIAEAGAQKGVNCSCRKGYVGDGLVCNGNLYQILSQGQYRTGRFYQKIVRKDFLYSIKLRQSANMTLFVPRNNALSRSRRVSRKVLARHIISDAVYTEADLRSASMVLVDSRMALPVQNGSDGLIYINGVPIITTDIPATNGIIHIIGGIIPKRISPIFPTIYPSRIISDSTSSLNKPTSYSTVQNKSLIINSTQSNQVSTTTITKKLSQSRVNVSSSVKVGIALGIFLFILIAVLAIYWRKRKGMFVFRPLAERFGRPRGDGLYEAPLGGSMDNPAYDSTSFRNPIGNFSGLDEDEEPMIFSEPTRIT